MEELNKNQIVLLTLLVSFVTSIATGIMTVSLLMEAPVEVSQTINRVVERTIEKVTPGDVLNTIQPKKEVTTVVVKEEDQIVSAIDKNIKSVVRIRERNKELGVDNLYGLGIVVTTDGLIATDKKIVSEVMQYSALTSDGVEIPLVSVYADKKSPLGFFKAKPEKPYTFKPVSFASADVKLGQSIVSIGGNTTNEIGVGRVTSLASLSTSTPITSFTADVAPADKVYGAPAFSLSGDLVGMTSSDTNSIYTSLPVNVIKKEVSLFNTQATQ
jgi:S1-C subfamily serine protease